MNLHTTDKSFQLVVLSNRLPVAWKTDSAGEQHPVLSPGGLVTALGPALVGKNVGWVGWSGHEEASEMPLSFEGMTLFPVSFDPQVMGGHYEGLSNRTLWPLCHEVGVEVEYQDEWWDSYRQANQVFAERVVEIVAPGGVVWVHDYQVMLASQIIRDLRPDVRIGYFHHIPFPGSFQNFSLSTELVNGVLGADVVGFQRTSDVAHFVDAATQAGVAKTINTTNLSVGDRQVVVDAFPISVDFLAVSQAAASEKVAQKAQELRHQMGQNTTIFLGVDRIDYTKGIPERLQAYETLLDAGDLSVEDVVFIQAGSPSRENVGAYQDLATRIQTLVENINTGHVSTKGRVAVHYLAENLSRENMLALFVAADVMVVNSLRDGMNLVAKEFVACRNDDSGVLILSTTTGASDHMPVALLIDPADQNQIANAMLEATAMSKDESNQRMSALRDYLRVNDVAKWSRDFLETLEASPGQS